MRVPYAIATLLVLGTTPVLLRARTADAPTPAASTSYTISATLDPINRLIIGRGRLVWRNTSSEPATELRFHMYWNAWRDDRSSWMREARLGGDASLADRPASDNAFIDLTTLALEGTGGAPASLLSRAHYIAPDDGNADDRTVLAVPLDHPIASGESVTIDLAWNAHVPRPYARTGVIAKNFFIANWFPQLGVLRDDGWHCHQFHVASEISSDAASYDVSLSLPAGWVVGSTGIETGQTAASGGTTTHRFVANDVRDFAWTTDPSYVEREETISQSGGSPVEVRLLLQPEHRDQADRHFAAARTALAYYSGVLGPYPSSHLTIVDPVPVTTSAQGNSLGNLAFPGVVTAGTRWLSRPKDATVERAIARGIAAEYMLASAWAADSSDPPARERQGLTDYLAARVVGSAPPNTFAAVHRYFGGLVPWTYDDAEWSVLTNGEGLDRYREGAAWNAPAGPAWRVWPGAVPSVDAKTALILTSIERQIGADAMNRIFAIARPDAAPADGVPNGIFSAAEQAGGARVTSFVDATYRGSATFDYAVDRVLIEETDAGSFDSRVILRRLGSGVLPVDVRVRFGDGATVTEHWDGQDRWHDLRYRRGARVTDVTVDPDRVLTLDADYTNNSWTEKPQGRAAAYKLAIHWLDWFEQTLLTYAFFA